MRISLVISSLGPGGAERTLCELANWWATAGHQIELITIQQGGKSFYPLDPRIQRRSAGQAPSRALIGRLVDNWRRIQALRNHIFRFRPDFAVSFVDTSNVTTISAALGTGVPVIVSERTDPGANPYLPRPWRLARGALYRRASAVVAQTRRAAGWLDQHCNVRTEVIENALRTLPDAAAPNREKLVLSVGRLDPLKGHDLAIRAFASSCAPALGWRMAILGQGPERDALATLITELGLETCVELAGAVTPIEPWFERASISVLASHFEGFPNALIEAMAMGCAVISTDCPSGPGELIESGLNGILVPVADVVAIGRAIDSLVDDGDLRTRLGDAAVAIRQRLDPQRIFGQWDKLAKKIVSASSRRGADS